MYIFSRSSAENSAPFIPRVSTEPVNKIGYITFYFANIQNIFLKKLYILRVYHEGVMS